MSVPSVRALPQPSSDWDAFVSSCSPHQPYWYAAWTSLPREVFGHETHFMECRGADGRLQAVLPLVRQRSRLLGDFATSLPFFNYGGVLGGDDAIVRHLMQQAQAWARQAGCAYIEFRDVIPRPGDWTVRTDKASMVLELPGTFAQLGKQLGAKLRSQVKRAEREHAQLRTGGIELLEDFYRVFARNMRDLGTPVYPRRFFSAILEKFPQDCTLVVLYRGGAPHAAGFLVFHADQVEIPWAGCSADSKPWGFNMKLYWETLALAQDRGARRFDFGRSTIDSGTFRFKKQWGAQPIQLYWHRWDREPPRKGRLMQHATKAWQRLPLGVANALGPLVSPYLPW